MHILWFLLHVFTPMHLLAMTAGVLCGLVIGSLPGLTANLGVALLLPMTASMDATSALLMLMSVYTAAIYGGALPAILLNAPGNWASAATAADGYALTQRGESNKAIRVATFGSVVGGVASAIALMLFAPPLSMLAVKFGPAEYFMLAIFGLTIIGTLSSGNIMKGLLSGAFGMLLSTVGLDLDSGFPRYTFGSFNLQSGVSFVPAAIGLFSLSQALLMCEDANNEPPRLRSAKEPWRFVPTWDEIRQIRGTVARSSLLGIFIGLVPAGAGIGSWFSYNEAKRFARDKSEFGKGSIVGIAASESGANAVTGSSLIPLLTLGVPGSTTAAILMGALLMHGLQPGQTLFTKQASITYTAILGFLVANMLMGVIGMGVGRYMAQVTRLPNSALIPIIFVLSIVGSYSLGKNMFDVYTMMAFGLLGYFMRKVGFHPAPMILGMILGAIAETGFRQSVVLANKPVIAYILSSPISLVFVVLTLISIGTAIWLELRPLGKQPATPTVPAPTTPAGSPD